MSADIDTLWRERPRSRVLRVAVLLAVVLVACAWLFGGFEGADLLSHRRLANLERFLHEIVPQSLRGHFELSGLFSWAWHRLTERGFVAAMRTFAISLCAIVLAAAIAGPLAVNAARNLATAEPFLPVPGTPARERVWSVIATATGLFLVLLRAIPEYVWAFLLLAILGPTSWPAILALAIHNSGILGKLGAETIEDIDEGPLRALRSLGAGRASLAVFAVFPMVLSRFLLFFFYRWESCVREATVLGMLGGSSLGWWITDARFRFRYDEMLFLILLGGVIVLVGDFVSFITRGLVRRAS